MRNCVYPLNKLVKRQGKAASASLDCLSFAPHAGVYFDLESSAIDFLHKAFSVASAYKNSGVKTDFLWFIFIVLYPREESTLHGGG